jgi:hypothetical protein
MAVFFRQAKHVKDLGATFGKATLTIAFVMAEEFENEGTATTQERFPLFLANLNCPFVLLNAVLAVLDIHHYWML